MLEETPLTALIRDTEIDVQGLNVDEVASKMKPVMDRQGVCLVSHFPADADAFIGLLERFGEPLENYSSLSDLDKDDPNTKINRVRYKRKKADERMSVHYIGGELKPHSARSWRSSRPGYFSMLMVNPGWRDTPPGQRGESVILSWEYLFTQLAERDGDVFERHFDRLCNTPLCFEANNVKEDVSSSPLCYPLPDAKSRFDVGVRLKQDLQEKLEKIRAQFPDFDAYRASLDYLVDAASGHEYQALFPMHAGNLVLIDNNRFAHGRCRIVAEREIDGQTLVNPRELWSVSVA